MNKPTAIPKNIDGKPKQPRVPQPDQEAAGLDAEGNQTYRRKASAIPGPRAGKSSEDIVNGQRRGRT
ncbi:hypothetical protein SAMN05216196_102505 [Lutimaribacter pacificus]|uniref:Uncharacterized protein n=1 Tax=Lutimaribacter pacificus TaxID=391948 RepID=A0A1H0F7Q2_9RHOB|nr:hypothetical protein [Lutimaribacter pacificus]SDN90674.1 hypothetical protein SAMN05216196_102505 [Lutimaribacter pacificus]SHK45937.1 hypothetical protein SAMN05444142_105219 [Lutimaribacter pacificus]